MSTPKRQVPVNTPVLGGNEKAYLLDCIETGWISSEGPAIAKFEKSFSTRVGRRHGVAVSNGSVALDAAVQALKLPPGSEVLVPSFTIISCAAAVIRAGLKPVFVDADPATWNLDVNLLRNHVTEKTRAVMPVHIYGLPVDMTPLMALAAELDLAVIEDAAEAIGLECDGRPCGSFGQVSTFSFYPNKHITTGEGGMVATDDPVIYERVRSLRNLCFQADRRFVHEELGYNFRMTNLQAALGLAQLEQLDGFLVKKRWIGSLYNELLSDLSDLIELPLPSTPYADNVYWVYGIVLRDHVPMDASAAMKKLAPLGVGTRPFFWPMHEQPVFEKMGLADGIERPVASRIARRGFYLPSGLALTEEDVKHSAESLRECLHSA